LLARQRRTLRGPGARGRSRATVGCFVAYHAGNCTGKDLSGTAADLKTQGHYLCPCGISWIETDRNICFCIAGKTRAAEHAGCAARRDPSVCAHRSGTLVRLMRLRAAAWFHEVPKRVLQDNMERCWSRHFPAAGTPETPIGRRKIVSEARWSHRQALVSIGLLSRKVFTVVL
jgi:hypothetical protein